MRYQVMGVRTQQITVEVDAESVQEAMDIAYQTNSLYVDVWDSDDNFLDAIPLY